MRDFWPGGNTAKISFESVKWRVSHQFVDVNNMMPADKMPESESKAKHNDSRRNSHASARMPYTKPKYIQRIPLKQIRSGSPGRGVRKSVDLLSDSGLRPSLVRKSKICSPLRASSPRLFTRQSRYTRSPNQHGTYLSCVKTVRQPVTV
jgi:hypothetical protein